MKVLTQNLQTGETDILDVPSPSKTSSKIRVLNNYSLISTGTESLIVNFGKAGFINKARQQPDRVKDVINKIIASGLKETITAIRNKLSLPIPMGYASVGTVSLDNDDYNLSKGTRVFTNSYHQEEALIDDNLCVKIPENVDDKSASFGAIGGIAMQSIKCIPHQSKYIAIIGLGLLGQVTCRILNALEYKCIAYDIDINKVKIAMKNGVEGIEDNSITESILNFTKGRGVDCTIIAASSLSNNIVNEATEYTRRKGKIISSGLIGLNLIREQFFKKQIELVVSNSSGDKNHKGEGSSHQNISYFFELLNLKKFEVSDLISEQISFKKPEKIYSFPNDGTFFSKLICYDNNAENRFQTISSIKEKIDTKKLQIGLIGAGNFALSTLIPELKKSKEGNLFAILGKEGLSLSTAMKKFGVNTITTKEGDFYNKIDALFVATPHQTHFHFLNTAIKNSLSCWVEKPMVISIDELIQIRKKMLSNRLIYFVGYNRSFAPWTNFMINKINHKKTNISMTINAGQLPADHWLLDESTFGGRILGECCHFIDLAMTLLNHTQLIRIDCVCRDRYYQDTGNYILSFEDGSKVNINYTYNLPASVPKEKIVVESYSSKYINNNWKKFFGGKIFDFNKIKKGKGHKESISHFFKRVKNNRVSTENEINDIVFSTYVAIKLQKMSKGDFLDIFDCYKDEILSNPSTY